MKIENLERFGLPGQLIKRWSLEGIKFLLPLQSEAVIRFGLLDGKSLIVSGPGTSGKTFCGELAAAAKATGKGKAVFLVPLKAIAEEKYRTFEKRYGALGLKIRLATRDHTSHDNDISKRNFDIAIMIYEKFNCLTANDISIIKNTSCFVLDEFQLIADGKRGIELELIIQKIRKFNPVAQIVILIGGGSSPDRISRWLKLPALSERRRPVDLRLGVFHRGTFHFRGFNDLSEGDERWLPQIEASDDEPISSQNLAAIKHLSSQDEQILIFTNTKRKSVELAEYLATHLDFSPARTAFASLSEAPPSLQNETLGRCLNKGVAFHHAELDEHQRQVVEDGFRSGEIKILTSTSTLAWGVNLPAKNVFIETMKYSGHRSASSGMMIEPMTGVDFQQAAGRAGRLGNKQAFGRAIITAETPYEQEILWDKYVYSSNEDPISAFSESDLPDLILRLLSCGVATKPDEIDKSCEALYGAFDTDLANNLSHKVNEALVFLESGGLVAIRNGGKIETTSMGQACCATALSAHSAINIRDLALKDKISGSYEWLLVALGLKEWMENSSGYYCPASASDILSERLSGVISEYELDYSNPIVSAIRNIDNPANRSKLTAFLFALDWCAGTPTTNMEKLYNKGAGGLKKDARTLSWIISAIDKIIRILLPPSSDEKRSISNLGILAEKLHYGVDDRMLPLASALDIDREFIRRLYDSGIISREHLVEADAGSLSGIVPGSVILKIERWRKKRLDEKCNFSHINVAEVPLGPRNNTEPQILFTGNNLKQKCEVKIGEHSIYLPPRLYSYFQKLWWAYKSQNPLVHRDSLDAGPNQAKYISKLRKLLQRTGIDIISNGRGSYHITIHENS